MSDSPTEKAPLIFIGSEMAELLRAGQERALSASSLLYDEGQLANHCYVVTEGTIELAQTIDGRYHALSQHGPGSILALMAALDGGPARVSMRATERVKLVEITREALCAIFGDEPRYAALADQLTITAIRRLRNATDELAQAIHRSLTATRRPGHMDVVDLAKIHAGNHAWKLVG